MERMKDYGSAAAALFAGTILFRVIAVSFTPVDAGDSLEIGRIAGVLWPFFPLGILLFWIVLRIIPPKGDDPPRISGRYLAVGILVYLVASFIGIVVERLGIEPFAEGRGISPSVVSALPNEYIAILWPQGAAAISLLYLLRPRREFIVPGGGREGLKDAAAGILSAAALAPVLALGIRFIPIEEFSSMAISPPVFFMGRPEATLLVFTIPIIIIPFCEELFFRVCLFGFLRERLGFAASAVLSAAVFSAAHFDPVLFIPRFAGGLLMAVLYERSGRMLPSWACHGALNAGLTLAPWIL